MPMPGIIGGSIMAAAVIGSSMPTGGGMTGGRGPMPIAAPIIMPMSGGIMGIPGGGIPAIMPAIIIESMKAFCMPATSWPPAPGGTPCIADWSNQRSEKGESV